MRSEEKDVRSRNWCLRLSNPKPKECEQDSSLFEFPIQDDERVRFAKWAYEVSGGDTHLHHIQGIVIFYQAVRWSAMLKMFRGWWFQAKSQRSTLEQFLSYPGKVEKAGEIRWTLEAGEPPKSLAVGEDELSVIHRELLDGASIDDVWESHFSTMVRQFRGVYEYFYYKMRGRQQEKTKSFDPKDFS